MEPLEPGVDGAVGDVVLPWVSESGEVRVQVCIRLDRQPGADLQEVQLRVLLHVSLPEVCAMRLYTCSNWAKYRSESYDRKQAICGYDSGPRIWRSQRAPPPA